jgi:hypothetical protein
VPATVRRQDRKDILELARKVGIGDPMSVSERFHLSCVLYVTSKPVVNGHRVLSQVVGVRPLAGRQCPPLRTDLTYERQGNWIATVYKTNPQEHWRIQDRDWSLDVSLGKGVPYEDAAQIVREIRQKQFIDRRPDCRLAIPLDPNSIVSVDHWPFLGGEPPVGTRDYRVMTVVGPDGGHWIRAKLHNGRVEVVAYGCWFS